MLGTVKPANSLSTRDVADWIEIQEAQPAYRSPFYRPEFTMAVAAVRSDAAVFIARQNDRTAGFLPYVQRGGLLADPIGGYMNDFHGPIACSGMASPATSWLKAAGLRAYRFTHLPVMHPHMTTEPAIVEESPYVDLSRGYDDYLQNHLHKSRREVPVARQKLRRAIREVGPVRFTLQDSGDTLPLLIQWKLAQCRQAFRYSVLSEAWAQRLIERLMDCREAGFASVYSTLSLGGEPAAGLFSLRSHDTLHGCITAYNPAFAAYSPGMQLMLQVVREAATVGITRIDLGRGVERFKLCLANRSLQVGEGCVALNPLTASIWRASLRLRRRLRASALWPLVARARIRPITSL